MRTIDLPDRPFTRRDAFDLGLSRHRLDDMVRNGELRMLVRGVYADADRPITHELIATALSLVVSPQHVVTDRTAALLHGIDCFSYAESGGLPRVETCAVRGSHPTERRQARGMTRTLAPGDVTEVHGIRVTTPRRTAMDLGCHLHRREAMAVLNAFAHEYGVTGAELGRDLSRFRGRRGVVQLRDLIPLVDGRIESARESWVWLEIIAFGLPRPEPQYWIEIDGVPTYRLDFAYPRQRVAVEYDGEDFHSSDEQRRADAERRAWLRRNGWTVVVVRKGDFTGHRLDDWLRRVRRALAEAPTTRRW